MTTKRRRHTDGTCRHRPQRRAPSSARHTASAYLRRSCLSSTSRRSMMSSTSICSTAAATARSTASTISASTTRTSAIFQASSSRRALVQTIKSRYLFLKTHRSTRASASSSCRARPSRARATAQKHRRSTSRWNSRQASIMSMIRAITTMRPQNFCSSTARDRATTGTILKRTMRAITIA